MAEMIGSTKFIATSSSMPNREADSAGRRWSPIVPPTASVQPPAQISPAEKRPMMSLADAKLLKPRDRVRVLCDGIGDVDGEGELTFAAGEILTVAAVDTFRAPQGFAVTVYAANGVVNVFDEADFDGRYPFEKVAEGS